MQNKLKLRKIEVLLFATPVLVVALALGGNLVARSLAAVPPSPPVKLTGPGGVVAPSSRTGMVYSAAFAPNSRILASGDDAASVKLWDVRTGQVTRTFTGHQGIVHSLAFSSDGKQLLSGSTVYKPYLDGGEMKLWDVASGKALRSLAWKDFYIRVVAFAPDNKTVALGGLKAKGEKAATVVELRDAPTGKLLKTLTQTEDRRYEISSLVFSPDGKLLASPMQAGGKLWSVATGKVLRALPHHGGLLPEPVAFSPDSKVLAQGYGGTVELRSALTGVLLSTLTVPLQRAGLGLEKIAFLSDTEVLGKMPFDLCLWDTRPGEPVKILEGYGHLGEAVLSRDRRMLAGKAGNDLMLQKLDWDNARVVRP
ncbi:MAG TPA: hypothetical protein VNA16_10270 [Abditibacteriaceae bacterium]|nr:hypothetical protein [Abditibacteriaceae bacterium]